jgi:hypothetical protein
VHLVDYYQSTSEALHLALSSKEEEENGLVSVWCSKLIVLLACLPPSQNAALFNDRSMVMNANEAIIARKDFIFAFYDQMNFSETNFCCFFLILFLKLLSPRHATTITKLLRFITVRK